MYNSLRDKILSRIQGHGGGWVFSSHDFIHEFQRYEIDQTLSGLAKKGDIRRIMRGVYDYPRYSEILKKQVAPDVSQVASALARKFRWSLQPEGNTALNALGLSTQIPAKYCYFSSGPNRRYIIDGQTLEFRKKSSRETAMRHPESMLVVHALKALGENGVTPELIEKLTARYTTAQWSKIKADTTTATGWVYEIIRNIADGKEGKCEGLSSHAGDDFRFLSRLGIHPGATCGT